MISRMPNGAANPAQGCLLLVRHCGCQSGKVAFNAILNAQVACVNEHAQTFVASLVVNILVAEVIKGTAKDLPETYLLASEQFEHCDGAVDLLG